MGLLCQSLLLHNPTYSSYTRLQPKHDTSWNGANSFTQNHRNARKSTTWDVKPTKYPPLENDPPSCKVGNANNSPLFKKPK
eukprot:3009536-Amphidinium_carterae.1